MITAGFTIGVMPELLTLVLRTTSPLRLHHIDGW